jgi:hypothetical protein
VECMVWYIRPAVWCYPGCRRNKCRTPASSTVESRRHQRERYSIHASHSSRGGRKEAGYAETLL